MRPLVADDYGEPQVVSKPKMSSNNSTIPDSFPNSSTLTHQTPATGLASKMMSLRGNRSSLKNLIYIKQMQFKNQTQPSRSLKTIPNLH